MIRRMLLLSTLLAAVATWGPGHLPPPTLATVHEVAASAAHAPGAFLGSAGPGLAAVLQDGFGSGNRVFPKRPDLFDQAGGYAQCPAAHTAASRAAGIAHLRYSASFALARAGRLASPTTAPPPFRFV
jgi:hypothetical protein